MLHIPNIPCMHNPLSIMWKENVIHVIRVKLSDQDIPSKSGFTSTHVSTSMVSNPIRPFPIARVKVRRAKKQGVVSGVFFKLAQVCQYCKRTPQPYVLVVGLNSVNPRREMPKRVMGDLQRSFSPPAPGLRGFSLPVIPAELKNAHGVKVFSGDTTHLIDVFPPIPQQDGVDVHETKSSGQGEAAKRLPGERGTGQSFGTCRRSEGFKARRDTSTSNSRGHPLSGEIRQNLIRTLHLSAAAGIGCRLESYTGHYIWIGGRSTSTSQRGGKFCWVWCDSAGFGFHSDCDHIGAFRFSCTHY